MHPILLNTNLSSANRFRPEIIAFAWQWPNQWVWSGDDWYRSWNSVNLFANSEDLTNTNMWERPSNGNIKSITAGATAPDGTTTAFAIGISGGLPENVYAYLRQVQYELKPGTTYTYSYWRSGPTGGQFRDINNTGTVLSNDTQPNLSFTSGTAWTRFSRTFKTQPQQDASFFYILSRSNNPGELSGATVYLWHPQLEEGSTATNYVPTGAYIDNRGGSYGGATFATYSYNQNNWLNYSTNAGVTYVYPFVNLFRERNYKVDIPNGWTLNSEIKRITSQLKALPKGKRAFQPTIMNADEWFKMTSDKLGATGAASRTYYTDVYPHVGSNLSNFYPSPWSDAGALAGASFFNIVLDIFGSTGVGLDYVFGDNESYFPQNFGVVGVTNGITGHILDPNYNSSWNGLSSYAGFMNLYGVCGFNIKGPAPIPNGGSNDKVAYLVWNNIGKQHVAYVQNQMWANPSLQRYPNATVSNYSFYNSDGGPTAGAPDPFGHPQFYNNAIVGNVPSQPLYGEIIQINDSVNHRVNIADPTYIDLFVSGSTGQTFARGPWTSFTQSMQELRSMKRGSPNTPITPWIGSVKYTNQTYNDSTKPPVVGYCDSPAGYNKLLGFTVGAGGNSAYYYELIKHTCLHGVKAIGYWNSSSFSYYDQPASESYAGIGIREYYARGYTFHVNDINLFNAAIKDVNDNLGGYRLQTADSSRVSWLADYITSGAPKTGDSYLWRVTVKPGTIFEYPDSALNPSKVLSGSCVGTWITTNTSTPPVVQPQTLKDTFYVLGPTSTDNGIAAQGNGTTYANWLSLNKDVVTTFQGFPCTSNQNFVLVARGRPYDFEFNPTNPQVSSPWHNVFYELCFDAYKWGARSFYLSYPLGQIPYLAYPFKDVVNRERKVYTSGTDAAYCPARWKGFTSAIKGLLEGTLNPAGACAAKAGLGFTAMTEGCNVMMYFQSTSGYWENRFGNTGAGINGLTFYEGSLKLWDDCFDSAGTSSGADALYYSFVDQFVNEIISIKSNLGTAGSLSCAFDATVESATPGTVGLFQYLPAHYTRGNSYELTDWYIQERLRMAGIQSYVEARTPKYVTLLNMGITGAGWDATAPEGDPAKLRGLDIGNIRFNNKNLLMSSENFAYPAAWQRGINARVSGPTYGPTPISTTNANQITFTQQFSVIYQVPTIGQQTALSAGNTCTLSMWIKRVSGNTALNMYHFNGPTSNNFTPITVTNDWVRYSTSFVPSKTSIEVGIQDRNISGFGSVLVWGAQLESGSTATSYQSTTGKTDWKNWLSVEYTTWYQAPINPASGATQDGYYSGYLPDEETPTCFRWSQNTGPLPPSKDPYQVPNTISTGGVSYTLPFGFATYYNSPSKYLQDLYAASDVYRKFNNLANTGLTFSGVAYDQPTKGYIINYNDYARGSCGNLEVSVINNYSSLTGYYRASTEQNQQGNMIGYAPPYTKAFDANGFINGGGSGASYAANGACGFWQLSSVTFWRENVKQPTFDGFLNMLRQVSLTGCPPYGNNAGWTGATYPNDFYSLNIIPKSMRP